MILKNILQLFKNIFFICALLLISGCLDDKVTEKPKAVTLSIDHNGYFCSMTIMDHPGPKAQIHILGEKQPLWFSQVRDMFGFIMLPGEARDIAALYVTDMSKTNDWNNTNDAPWIDPKNAWFVINSNKIGGMGALEVVPFSIKDDAIEFVDEFGGQILPYDKIPSKYIFDTSMSQTVNN